MTDTHMTYPFDTDKLTVDPRYAELREGPLHRVRLPYGEPAWLATRYADIKTVLADPRFSRAAAVGRDEPRTRPHAVGPGTIMSFDPPEHSRLRRLASQAFTVRRVEALRVRAQQIADELIDTMLAKGAPADLVADFGLPLPTIVICELLGVPVADRGEFRVWSDAFMSTTKYTPEQVKSYLAELTDYMAGLIVERRKSARDDLLSALVAARDNDDRLTEEELLILAQSLLVAGHETTASQIPNFVYTLLTHPEQLAALRTDPDLIPQAVEELLRYVPLGTGGGLPRYAVEDVQLGAVTVRAGEPVLVALHSANRDETVFTRPDELDLLRPPTSHISFGHGAHHCLGAPLARMELQVAIATLVNRVPGLRLTREHDIVWKTGVSTRGPERMPITWG
ncbi:cytochrome P450 [Nocardia sp. CA-120079]|uniref:cytochrome P450 n=1 Tax=Nocardia sp. CA-120079 TaxID=3239974 RepID=UPI003D97F693